MNTDQYLIHDAAECLFNDTYQMHWSILFYNERKLAMNACVAEGHSSEKLEVSENK